MINSGHIRLACDLKVQLIPTMGVELFSLRRWILYMQISLCLMGIRHVVSF